MPNIYIVCDNHSEFLFYLQCRYMYVQSV